MTSRTRRVLRRAAAVCIGAAALLALPAGSPLAQAATGPTPTGPDSSFVVVNGQLDVPAGVTVRIAVIFNGPLHVEGTVTESAVAFNGDVVVDGTVGRNAVALNGRVILSSRAHVGGNVVSRQAPIVSPGATVAGSIRQQDFSFQWGTLGFFGRIAWWIAVSIASLITGLILVLVWPRASDALAERAREGLAPSIGWGFLVFVGIPVVAVIAIATVIGLLFGLSLLLGLLLLYGVAYTAGTYAFGRSLLKPPAKRSLSFLLGWGILRAAALVPVVGSLLFVAAAVWGFGAIVSAARRAGRETPTTVGLPLPPPHPGPLPPMPAAGGDA